MEKPDFKKRGGLVPVIAQDIHTGSVLMLAYANEEAYKETLETGLATYYSTSRKKVCVKGATSGNYQKVKEVFVDCDNDAVLYRVIQEGDGACHTGNITCFFKKVTQ